MSVKRFVKGLLHPHSDFDFHSLKSNSSVELSQYSRGSSCGQRGNRAKSQLPRYYSQYEQLSRSSSPLSAPPPSGTAEMVVIPAKSDSLESLAVCLSFVHYSGTAMTTSSDSCVLEDSYFSGAIDTCCQLKGQSTFNQGLLLKCTDPQTPFPYLHYAVFETQTHSFHPGRKEQFQKELTRIGDSRCQGVQQTFGLYEEVSSVIRRNEVIQSRLPSGKHSGYIVIGCKVLGVNDSHQLEESWLNWSGAREICKYSPKGWGLKRVTFHRQYQSTVGPDSFVYVILCEYANLLSPGQLMAAYDFVARLRTRNCGYVGLYRCHWVYDREGRGAEGQTPLPPGIVRLEEAQNQLKSAGSLLVETDRNLNELANLSEGSQLTLNTFDGDLLCD